MAGPWDEYSKPSAVSQPVKGPWDEYAPPAAAPEPEKSVMDYIKGFGDFTLDMQNKAAQGLTLGFWDEIQGAGAGSVAAVKNLFEGKDANWLAEYNRATKKAREADADFENKYPKTAIASEIAGGFLLPGRAVASGVKKAPGVISKMVEGAKGGGIVGGIAGAGYADGGMADRLKGSAQGAAAGLAVGAALPPVIGGLQKVGAGVRQMLPGTKDAIAKSKMAEALVRDDMTPDILARRSKAASPETMTVDIAGENVLGLGRSVANTPGAGKQMARKKLVSRELGSERRAVNSLKKYMGDGRQYYGEIDAIQAARKEAASELYGKAYQATPEQLQTPKMKGLLERPAMADAYKEAQKIAGVENIQLPPLYDDTGKFIVRAKPTMQAMDIMKQALDDKVSAAYRAGHGQYGTALRNLRDDFKRELDRVNPDYRQARNIYAGHSANLDALDLGRKFVKEDAEITKRLVKDMTESERTFFRQGVARAVIDNIESKTWTSDQTRQWLNVTKNKRKLMAAFPNIEDFHGFMKDLLDISKHHRTYNVVLGNSQTAAKLGEVADLGARPSVGGDIARLFSGQPGMQIGAGGRMVGRGLDLFKPQQEDVANILAPHLFGHPAGAEKFLKSLPMGRVRAESLLPGAVIGSSVPQGRRIPEEYQPASFWK